MANKCFLWFSLIFIACSKQVFCDSEITGPTVGMLKTAYCACICCETDESKCHKHSAVEKDYVCISDDCTEEFCVKWQKAKCTSSCFCSKCKSRLPATSQRCHLYNGVPPECQCGDFQDINCEDQIPDEDTELAKAKEHIRKLQEKNVCVVPCFCRKCFDKLPPSLHKECDQSKHLPEDCSCKNTKCPTDRELDTYNRIQKENMNTSDIAKILLQESKSRAELDAMNAKLKPAIESGQINALGMDDFKKTKCGMQCMCDKCRWDNPILESNCQKMLQQRDSNCPPCAEEINCPEGGPEGMCKMYCFCSKCKKDKRMTKEIKGQCEVMLAAATEICPCKEHIDCNILDQIGKLNKGKEAKKTSDDGKPRPGKLKAKSKMWDEL